MIFYRFQLALVVFLFGYTQLARDSVAEVMYKNALVHNCTLWSRWSRVAEHEQKPQRLIPFRAGACSKTLSHPHHCLFKAFFFLMCSLDLKCWAITDEYRSPLQWYKWSGYNCEMREGGMALWLRPLAGNPENLRYIPGSGTDSLIWPWVGHLGQILCWDNLSLQWSSDKLPQIGV